MARKSKKTSDVEKPTTKRKYTKRKKTKVEPEIEVKNIEETSVKEPIEEKTVVEKTTDETPLEVKGVVLNYSGNVEPTGRRKRRRRLLGF